MTLRESPQMVQDGFLTIPFPSALSRAMKSHIAHYILGKEETNFLPKLTQKLSEFSDEAFTEKFAKPFRIFPEAVAQKMLDWVAGLATELGGKQAGVNYVCLEERKKNPALTPRSFDIFWRCVRPKKPDVGAAHCDFQFWELARGTSLDVETPFDYDERWKIWVPLIGCDATNSLEVIPGSHAEEVPIDKILTKNGYKPSIKPLWLEKNEKNFRCPLTSFADRCILFHDKLVHRGPPNNTAQLRLSGELTILLRR